MAEYIRLATLQITMRELRTHLAETIKRGEPRILGTRRKARALIIPIDPSEWHGSRGMDRRLRLTRQRIEDALSHLEH